MNYIEAHRIVDNFTFAFAYETKAYLSGLYPIRLLRGMDLATYKRELTNAIKLYIAHGMFWSTISKKEIDSLFILSMYIDNFVDDAKAEKINEALKVLEKAKNSKLYSSLNKEKIGLALELWSESFENHNSPLYYDEIVDFYNESISLIEKHRRIKKDALEGKNNKTLPDIVFEGCIEIYNLAQIPYKQGNDIFFFTIHQMKQWCKNNDFSEWLSPYKDYILSLKSEEQYI